MSQLSTDKSRQNARYIWMYSTLNIIKDQIQAIKSNTFKPKPKNNIPIYNVSFDDMKFRSAVMNNIDNIKTDISRVYYDNISVINSIYNRYSIEQLTADTNFTQYIDDIVTYDDVLNIYNNFNNLIMIHITKILNNNIIRETHQQLVITYLFNPPIDLKLFIKMIIGTGTKHLTKLNNAITGNALQFVYNNMIIYQFLYKSFINIDPLIVEFDNLYINNSKQFKNYYEFYYQVYLLDYKIYQEQNPDSSSAAESQHPPSTQPSSVPSGSAAAPQQQQQTQASILGQAQASRPAPQQQQSQQTQARPRASKIKSRPTMDVDAEPARKRMDLKLIDVISNMEVGNELPTIMNDIEAHTANLNQQLQSSQKELAELKQSSQKELEKLKQDSQKEIAKLRQERQGEIDTLKGQLQEQATEVERYQEYIEEGNAYDNESYTTSDQKEPYESAELSIQDIVGRITYMTNEFNDIYDAKYMFIEMEQRLNNIFNLGENLKLLFPLALFNTPNLNQYIQNNLNIYTKIHNLLPDDNSNKRLFAGYANIIQLLMNNKRYNELKYNPNIMGEIKESDYMGPTIHNYCSYNDNYSKRITFVNNPGIEAYYKIDNTNPQRPIIIHIYVCPFMNNKTISNSNALLFYIQLLYYFINLNQNIICKFQLNPRISPMINQIYANFLNFILGFDMESTNNNLYTYPSNINSTQYISYLIFLLYFTNSTIFNALYAYYISKIQ